MDSSEKEEIIINERMKWLSFFHYISGGLTLVFSSFFIIYLVVIGFVAFNPDLMGHGDVEKAEHARQFMKVFFGVFAFFVVFGIIYGICEIISGVYIKKRKNRVFSLIVAIPRIMFFPYGMLLSIFTLMLLERDNVKAQYAKNTGPEAS